jgi:hypothetical protein
MEDKKYSTKFGFQSCRNKNSNGTNLKEELLQNYYHHERSQCGRPYRWYCEYYRGCFDEICFRGHSISCRGLEDLFGLSDYSTTIGWRWYHAHQDADEV